MLSVVEYGQATDPGRQRRGNEDAFFVGPPFFAVADGMGGHQAGEVASGIAVEIFERAMPADGPPEERLAAAARTANERIHELSRSDRGRAGMGTTITAAHVGGDEVAIAHVGDSRAYRARDGVLEPLTRDHSLVQALIDQGRLSEEEAARHPQRSVITRALGPEPSVEVETRTYRARPGDVFLLCSDGLTAMVDDETIARIVAAAPSLSEAAQGLVDAANMAGGRDNITVVLFRLGEGEGAHADGADGQATARHDIADQPTSTGEDLKAPAIRAAVAEAERPEPVLARSPRPAPPPEGRRRAPRFRRRLKVALIVLAILVPILVGAWVATRAVYFVGTDSRGVVTIFQGVPYELPAGLKLYTHYYESGVPASSIPAVRRDKLLDHSLRSQRDATDLVDQLELGRLEQP
jgi:serine/threonine protein phosphatase PrpC